MQRIQRILPIQDRARSYQVRRSHGAKEGMHDKLSPTGTSDIDSKLRLRQKPNLVPALATVMPNRGDGPAAMSPGAIVSPPRVPCPFLESGLRKALPATAFAAAPHTARSLRIDG